ncbi:MAG: phosphatidate cytidylyltransferase [Armatimonadota bacterium]|nr:phosphatidate cytidylyltransferase [Armatimonadota bacterium]
MLIRIISALIGIPFAIILVYARGGAPFALIIAIIAMIGLWEFYGGSEKQGAKSLWWLGLPFSVSFIVAAWFKPALLDFSIVMLGLFLAMLIWELFRHDRAPIRNIGATLLGAVYVGGLFGYLVLLRQMPGKVDINYSSSWFDLQSRGAWLAMFAMLTTWACDTGAYFVGSTIGKHKLAPTLSPGKTIEGAVGAIVCSTLMALLIGGVLGFHIWSRILLGVVIGAFSILGDLCESAMKREIGIKDFGAIMPGHGGVLDRCDSLLFSAPALFYIIYFLKL